METPYYVELTVGTDDGDVVFELFKDKNLPLEQIKQVGGQFFMGGYVHQEDAVSLAPNFTLYPPTAIKKIRLVAMSVVQAPPGLRLLADETE